MIWEVAVTVATAPRYGSLPALDPQTGCLPDGVHVCTWDEFVLTFVDSAPHPEHRRRRLLALELFVDLLDELFPGSTLWLDGGFASHKAAAPYDIDVLAIVPAQQWADHWNEVQAELDALNSWVQNGQVGQPPKQPRLTAYGGLLTHQDIVSEKVPYPRIQPFGGLLDSFILPDNASAVLGSFEDGWRTDFATGARKGFVEVRPDGR